MDFRNPDKLISESGYYLTNLQSSIMFWQNVDYTSLSIDKSEFEKMTGKQFFDDDETLQQEIIQKETNKKEENKPTSPENERSLESQQNILLLLDSNDMTRPSTPIESLELIQDDNSELSSQHSGTSIELNENRILTLEDEKKLISLVSSMEKV